MEGDKQERWKQLCEQAAVEHDPKRLLELIEEINRMLSERKRPLLGGFSDNRYSVERPCTRRIPSADNEN
jgi:hypothetical protein